MRSPEYPMHMPKTSVPAILDSDHRRCVVGREPMIFHCHHYNTYLQRTILEDAPELDTAPVLVGAAAEMAHHQLSTLFQEQGLRSVGERKSFAEQLYQWAGFGTFDLGTLSADGGVTRTRNSHYALGWRVKFKQSSTPVCHFASGWLAGALAAIYDKPNGSYSVEHRTCSATGAHEDCAFELKAGQPNYDVFTPVGVGPLTTHRPRPVPENNVDYEGIFAALSGMPIVGNSEGIIPAFGVYLTRHYANYYNRISFEFERRLAERFGSVGRELAEPLLVEAGHACAFYTFGGIMSSTEWDALIRPSLKSREDWVHGMTAAANALGWGRWQVTRVSEREAEFVLHDDYESVGYLAMYGKSDHPVSYLAQGGVAGLMNLVYAGDIASRPELTEAFYDRLFRQEGMYRAVPQSSQAMGDEVTSFRVSRA